MYVTFNTTSPEVVGHVSVKPNKYDPSGLTSTDLMIEAETQYHQATPDFIEMNNPGIVTRAVLKQMREIIPSDDYHSLRIDVKVHMLMPSWYPSIPGWHCDFVARDENNIIHPNPELDSKVLHWAIVTGDNITATQFLVDRNVKIRVRKTPHWKFISAAVDKMVLSGKVSAYKIASGNIVLFQGDELHRGISSELPCWRYFCRASLFPIGDPRRPVGTQGKVRRQQQVYLDIRAGW